MGTPAPAPLKGVPYVRDAFTRGRRHRFSGADSAGAMGTPAPAPLKGVPYVRDAFTRGRRHRFSGADSAGAMGTPAPAPLKGVPYVRDAFTRGRRAPLHRCRFRRRDRDAGTGTPERGALRTGRLHSRS